MQNAGKIIIDGLKAGSSKETENLVKDFFAPAFTSTPLKVANLEYYGHFVNGFFRTAVSSLVSSGANPNLISSIDIIYSYYIHFRNHVKAANDSIFLPKAFHLILLNITKSLDYVDYALKFATCLYNELQLTNSGDNIDVFTNPAILWNFAGKLEKQPNFKDFILSLQVRHLSLRLLALKAKNLPSLVTKLGSAILRLRQQVSSSCAQEVRVANLESAAVWNSIVETVLLALGKEDKPKDFLLNALELHTHHTRFISLYDNTHPDTSKRFNDMRSFLDQHVDENDAYAESIFKICDGILFIGDTTTKRTSKALSGMFDSVKDASVKLVAALDQLSFGHVSLICDAYGIFIVGLSKYEPLKEGKLKATVLKVCVSLLETHLKMMHCYYGSLQTEMAESKEKVGRQDVYMCVNYSIFMEILYTLCEKDDSNKWLEKVSTIAKNYMIDIQGLSETPSKTKEKHLVYVGQWLRKFGRLCYNEGYNESGIGIYKLLLEQMKSLDLSEESNQQSYIKNHEYLAECQKRSNDWNGSFQTILSCISIQSSSAYATAVKIWLRIKKEAVKDLPDITNKTLQTLIKENESNLRKVKIDISVLLELEWKSIQNSSLFLRKKHKDYAVCLLTDLIVLSSDAFMKSRYLYELSLILWNSPQPTSKSGKDYLMEAIKLIEPSIKVAASKDKFLLGQEYLLLYTFEQEDFNQKNCLREKLLGIHTEPQRELAKPFSLQIESETMQKLQLSLDMFEEASVVQEEMCSNMNQMDIISLLNSIIFAASIFTASLKPLDAVRALTIATEVSHLTNNSEIKLKVLSQICNVLSSLGYPDLANSLMDSNLEMTQDSNATYSEKICFLVKSLAKAELFAEKGQFDKAYDLTVEVLSDCMVTSNKHKTSCVILAHGKHLLSKLKLMPFYNNCNDNNNLDDDSTKSNIKSETPLDLAYEAMRMYTAVIHCIFQPDIPTLTNSEFGGSTFEFEKYEIVFEIMNSLLYLSQLYCHVGEEREAKCYIKEGLRLAEIFVLPRWSAKFYLQLVRINFLSGKSNDIVKSSSEAKSILLLSNKDTEEETPESPCPDEESVEAVCTPENQATKNLVNKFRWSAECSDEESILKAETFTDHTPLAKNTVSKLSYSSASVINPPESPIHLETCLCQKCQDVVTLELALKCRLISGEFDYTFGRRLFQDNDQSQIESSYLQLSKLIQANLEHVFKNKVFRLFGKSGSKFTTGQSIYLKHCCSDLARTYLIRAQILEQNGEIQAAFDNAKTGLLLLNNISGYNNPDLYFLRAGLTLSLANTIPYVSDNVNINKLLEQNLNLDLLSSQLSEMSLGTNGLLQSHDLSDDIELCTDEFAALSVEDEVPKGRRDGTFTKVRKKMTSKEIKSIENTILLSPFPRKMQPRCLPVEETLTLTERQGLTVKSEGVNELPEETTSVSQVEPKTKAKQRASRTCRTSRASGQSQEASSKILDSEIEKERECSADNGDDCRIGNFCKSVGKGIGSDAGNGQIFEENLFGLETVGALEGVAENDPNLMESLEIDETEPQPNPAKTKVSKRSKLPKAANATRTRVKRATARTDYINDKTMDPLGEKKKATASSPDEKKISIVKKTIRVANRKGCLETLKTSENASPYPVSNEPKKIKPSKSDILKPKPGLVRKLLDENEQDKENKVYNFIGLQQETPSYKKMESKTNENKLSLVEEEKTKPSPVKKSLVKKTSQAGNRKGRNRTLKTPMSDSPTLLASKTEKVNLTDSKIFKSRKDVDCKKAEEEDQNKENSNLYDFDDIDKQPMPAKKATRPKRQPAAKNKSTGWQKRLAEASNRIGREVKRDAEEDLLEKRFSISPLSLSPVHLRLNDTADSVFFQDDYSSLDSSPDFSGHSSFDDIRVDVRDLGKLPLDVSNLCSPEVPRAANDGSGSDDCAPHRKLRTTRTASARALVSKVDNNENKKEKISETYPEDSDSISRHNMRFQSLESAFNQMRLFPPCSLYNFTCKALAMNYLSEDPDKAAFYLTEAQAVTLRHSLITQLSRKIRKLLKDQNANEIQKKMHICVKNAASLENLIKSKQSLSFGQKPSILHSLTNAIHPDWTVCQVSVVASPNFSSPPILVVTQYRHNASPTIISLPGYNQSGGNEILKSYESIQIANRKTLSILNKNEWWNARHNLNDKMQNILRQMEEFWFGCWKGILLGHLTNEDDQKKLQMSAEKIGNVIKEKCSKQANLGLIQILLDSCEYLSDEELNMAISQVTHLNDVQSTDFISIKSQILQLGKSLNSTISNRHPVILILDKVIQHLPWENLPILRNQCVSRIPSLYYLKVQMTYLHHKNSVVTNGFDPKSTFYVLNPDDNLPCTQKIFQKSFEATEGWEGVVSKPPTADQFVSALTQKDTMIYCGHGNGNKYLHGDYLQQLNCRAAALLMGCSSGQMLTKGILDETGMIINYYLAFCPVIVANLWDVTDRDIDRFLQTLLDNWILSKNETKMSLCEAVVKARSACKLSYLIGCAPVVYGIPL